MTEMTQMDLPDWLHCWLNVGLERVSRDLKQTHISWVLLIGEDAYKIKKPVNFGFVDFSTLSRRRHYCFEELRLNRRLAPELYRDVCGIYVKNDVTEADGSRDSPVLIDISDESDIDPPVSGYRLVDYAICMRRFSDERLLPEAMACGQLTPRHLQALAETVAGFHASIAVAPRHSDFGQPRRLIAPAQANFTFLKYLAELREYQPRIDALKTWSDAEAARLEKVMISRRDAGMVRECHGDMHLGNMILNQDGQIEIFDGIEFNDSFRWIDVASEIAFFVMDCLDRDQAAMANTFLNHYLEVTGDYQLLSVLPFYMVYRALVRAKVAFLRLSQQGGFELTENAGDTAQALESSLKKMPVVKAEIDQYMGLACDLVTKRPECLLINHGLSGSGKSYWTEKLINHTDDAEVADESLVSISSTPWLIRLRSDVERKRLESKGELEGEIYSLQATDTVYQTLARQAKQILDAGFSPVIDATFLNHGRRRIFHELATACHVPFAILSFEADDVILKQRLVVRKKSGVDPSDADEKVLLSQKHHQEPLTDDELVKTLKISKQDGAQVVIRTMRQFIQGLVD